MNVLCGWIETCSREHQSCKLGEPVGNPSFARILDVGDSANSTELRLRATSDISTPFQYATLSHCWGGATIPCLVEGNTDEYYHHIDLSSLPQTFKDAIQLTRQLNLRYLWVDSLCIVQDSHEDWLSQASLMGEIYRNSYLNISATNSSDPHGGLFSTRNPFAIAPLRLPIQHPGDEGNAIYYDVRDPFYQAWNGRVTHSPLCNRGWVVQERALAPRVVHFAKEKLYWECRENQSCEYYSGSSVDAVQPYAIRCRLDFKRWNPFARSLVEVPTEKHFGDDFVAAASTALKPRFLDETACSPREEDEQHKQHQYGLFAPTHPVIKYWSSIMLSYGQAKLTRTDDRLLAIAGLASVLSQRAELQYVAGHWTHQLARQLLWSYFRIDANEGAKTSPIAPTWSWASIGQGKSLGELALHPSLDKDGVLEVMKIQAIGSGKENNTAQFSGDTVLKVQGRLLPISLDVTGWPQGKSRPQAAVSYWQGSTMELPTGSTFLVPVLFFRWNNQLPSATPNALILESTDEQGRFRRVGCARIHPTVHLNTVYCQLYTLGANDGAAVSAEDDGRATTPETEQASNTQTTPEQELSNARYEEYASGQLDNLVGQVQHSMLRQFKKPPTGSRGSAVSKVAGGFQKLASNAHLFAEHLHPANSRQGPSGMGDGASSAAKEPVRVTPYHEAQRLAPKAAIAPHFYLEYVEDETAALYGNFVFEIV